MAEIEEKQLPLPKRDETFNTLGVATVLRTEDGRHKPIKAEKPKQLNLKIPPRLKQGIERAAEDANLSQAKFLGLLFEHWQRTQNETVSELLSDQGIIGSDDFPPSPEDIAAGRTVELRAYVTPAVHEYFVQYGGKRGWSLGATIQDLMMKLVRYQRAKTSQSEFDDSAVSKPKLGLLSRYMRGAA